MFGGEGAVPESHAAELVAAEESGRGGEACEGVAEYDEGVGWGEVVRLRVWSGLWSVECDCCIDWMALVAV